MYLYFEFTDNIKNLLFKGLNSSTPSALIVICLVSGIVTIFYELLMSYHEILLSAADKLNASYDIAMANNRRIGGFVNRPRLAYATLSSIVYTVRVTISMLLMLTVMTYNAWIFLSVVLGSSIGYFFSPLARRLFRACVVATLSPTAGDTSSAGVFVTAASSANAFEPDGFD